MRPTQRNHDWRWAFHTQVVFNIQLIQMLKNQTQGSPFRHQITWQLPPVCRPWRSWCTRPVHGALSARHPWFGFGSQCSRREPLPPCHQSPEFQLSGTQNAQFVWFGTQKTDFFQCPVSTKQKNHPFLWDSKWPPRCDAAAVRAERQGGDAVLVRVVDGLVLNETAFCGVVKTHRE